MDIHADNKRMGAGVVAEVNAAGPGLGTRVGRHFGIHARVFSEGKEILAGEIEAQLLQRQAFEQLFEVDPDRYV